MREEGGREIGVSYFVCLFMSQDCKQVIHVVSLFVIASTEQCTIVLGM